MSTELSKTDDLARSVVTTAIPRLRSRVAGFAVLGAVVALIAFVTQTLYFVVSDSWVAPIHLSPQSDAVLQLQVKLTREQAEMNRVAAEVDRIDGDLAAVEAGIHQLTALRASAAAPLTWQADLHADEHKTLGRVIATMRDEVKVLERVRKRQKKLTAAARRDLEAGLIVRRELDEHEQALDSLEVALAEKRRMLEQARHEKRAVAARTSAYRTELDAPGKGAESLMPEVAASQEHAARTGLELMRLEAEKRSLVGQRRVAAETLAKQKELLVELEARPLYRAIHQELDVAFVPYDQFEHVRPGARVMACTWGLILCEQVGTVSELLAGEVATLDPWGEMARGQYAILALDEPEAIREKVLRVRP